MPGSLLDVNVWLAASFEAHPAHTSAQAVILQAHTGAPALFCRATQQNFLRLASTPAIFQAYGSEALTNLDALAALQTFQALPQVELIEEPIGVERLWWQLAGLGKAAPKRWMDAYLAAFAITGSTRLISLDQDFRQFLPAGLDLLLLECPEPSMQVVGPELDLTLAGRKSCSVFPPILAITRPFGDMDPGTIAERQEILVG